MCQGRECTEDAIYECWDRMRPETRHQFCTRHYLMAARNAEAMGVKISTVQL